MFAIDILKSYLPVHSTVATYCEFRAVSGVARISLRGKYRGSGDGSPPAGSRGRAPVGVWAKLPEARDNSQKIVLKVA